MENRDGVFIVEEHKVLVDGLTLLINSTEDLYVSGSANCGKCALKGLRAEPTPPALILLGLALPDAPGFSLIERIVETYRDCPILILSMHKEEFFAPRVITAGARGFISKANDGVELLSAIRLILKGNIYINPKLTKQVLEHTFNTKPLAPKEAQHKPTTGINTLSPREIEIFEMLGRGQTAREISEQLFINVKTVETYRQRIRKKLDISSSQKLTAFAASWGSQSNLMIP